MLYVEEKLNKSQERITGKAFSRKYTNGSHARSKNRRECTPLVLTAVSLASNTQ